MGIQFDTSNYLLCNSFQNKTILSLVRISWMGAYPPQPLEWWNRHTQELQILPLTREGSSPSSSIISNQLWKILTAVAFSFSVIMRIKTQYLGMVLQDPFDLMVEEYASGQSNHRPDVVRNASEVRILPLLFRINRYIKSWCIREFNHILILKFILLGWNSIVYTKADGSKRGETRWVLLVQLQHILLG